MTDVMRSAEVCVRLSAIGVLVGLGSCTSLTIMPFAPAPPTITVVNMIPVTASAEALQNSEPSIGPHPTSTSIFAATAVMVDNFCPASPVETRSVAFVSRTDGNSWTLACILHMSTWSYPIDQTIRFSSDGNSLYTASILAEDWNTTYVTGNKRPFVFLPPLWIAALAVETSPVSAVNVLTSRTDSDQPQVETGPLPTTTNGLGVGLLLKDGPTVPACKLGALVFAMPDPWSAGISDFCLSSRPSAGATPTVRLAVSGDKTAYAVFYRPVTDGFHADVVVVRHGPMTFPPSPTFEYLKDLPADPGVVEADLLTPGFCTKRDGRSGYRVQRCVIIPYDPTPVFPSVFGQERRLGTQLAIAVDPGNSKRVIVAWGDSLAGGSSHMRLHFEMSTDWGENWTTLPFVVENGTNPALAIAKDGAVGFLYQQLVGGRWQTFFGLMEGAATLPVLYQLADAPATLPVRLTYMQTYLGDYIQLVARGNNYYGVFSTSNDRSKTTFWPGTIFQRLYNSTTNLPVDAYNNPVTTSIDPYFVKVIRP